MYNANTKGEDKEMPREQTHSIFFFFSVLHTLSARHTRSDRNLAKWDKIIKLQGTLLSFSAKWMKWCQHVTASPSGCENTDATINSSSYSVTRHWILLLRWGWMERAYKMAKKKNIRKYCRTKIHCRHADILLQWSSSGQNWFGVKTSCILNDGSLVCQNVVITCYGSRRNYIIKVKKWIVQNLNFQLVSKGNNCVRINTRWKWETLSSVGAETQTFDCA